MVQLEPQIRAAAMYKQEMEKRREERELRHRCQLQSAWNLFEADVLEGQCRPDRSGPLAMLRRMYESKRRVVVVTRKVSRIHGSFCGLLVLFDKHLNLLLEDAAADVVENMATLEDSVQKLRHVHSRIQRLFIKGDSVVSIRLLPDTPNTGQ